MIFEMVLLAGLLGVSSNPSPYYAALGLVGGAGAGCFVLMNGGVTFLSLVLFLVYLGGMMVVFGYCAALVAEPYPEAWGSSVVMVYLIMYGVLLVVGWMLWGFKWEAGGLDVCEGLHSLSICWLGLSEMFGVGGWVLFLGGWGLLLTLFVVLEVVRGHYSGALRVV
uniref:NADH-ubiquinone oxidoreductase chain 6 n=1 Tax=Breviceps adspersus TaxID=1283716 RepID=W0THR6_9NEOB|nr:NADH dehydrogenase subunit 6 [Breviceps adspersus]BAO42895.1 NADH dehydrogenase subunit 6 [Breviceps adspersus]